MRVGATEVIVAGLGAVGSAAAYHAACQGAHVRGFDRFAPPHAHGSSHGESRIFREAYAEGPHYGSLLSRSRHLWQALSAEMGCDLLHEVGALMAGPSSTGLVEQARRTAAASGVEVERMTPREVARRFPALCLPGDHEALFEPHAGWLDPEACLRAHLSGARLRGADLHLDEPVVGWRASGHGVEVATERGRYAAGALVLASGGWLLDLLPVLPLTVERQVNVWLRPTPGGELFAPGRCPVYIWEHEAGSWLYGFPDLGEGVKAGLHHGGPGAPHPSALSAASASDEARADATSRVMHRLMPDLSEGPRRVQPCFYTNTPDGHFRIGCHLERPRVVVASACSGHGFKTSSAVGEALAALALGLEPAADLTPFALELRTPGSRLRTPDL